MCSLSAKLILLDPRGPQQHHTLPSCGGVKLDGGSQWRWLLPTGIVRFPEEMGGLMKPGKPKRNQLNGTPRK